MERGLVEVEGEEASRRAGTEEHRLNEIGWKEYWRRKIQTETGALERSEEGGLTKLKMY